MRENTSADDAEFAELLRRAKSIYTNIPTAKCRKHYDMQSVRNIFAEEFGVGDYLTGMFDQFGAGNINLQSVFVCHATDYNGLTRVLKAVESAFDVDTTNIRNEIRRAARSDKDIRTIGRILINIECILGGVVGQSIPHKKMLDDIHIDIDKLFRK